MSRRAETAYRCGLIEGIILITTLAGRNTETPLMYRARPWYTGMYYRGEGVKWAARHVTLNNCARFFAAAIWRLVCVLGRCYCVLEQSCTCILVHTTAFSRAPGRQAPSYA